ncbi:hypothetical protein V6N12_054083 [Hibiscus sabdariffa]|uniref:Uncharacterized protein n=1 Tax=Hibiscus sabdariffa TaxID=183260 RepID=A0ABR1ZXH6_9ROSI
MLAAQDFSHQAVDIDSALNVYATREHEDSEVGDRLSGLWQMNEIPADFEAEQPANAAPSPANSAPSSPSATTNSSSDSIASHASNSSSESDTPPRKFRLQKRLGLGTIPVH